MPLSCLGGGGLVLGLLQPFFNVSLCAHLLHVGVSASGQDLWHHRRVPSRPCILRYVLELPVTIVVVIEGFHVGSRFRDSRRQQRFVQILTILAVVTLATAGCGAGLHRHGFTFQMGIFLHVGSDSRSPGAPKVPKVAVVVVVATILDCTCGVDLHRRGFIFQIDIFPHVGSNSRIPKVPKISEIVVVGTACTICRRLSGLCCWRWRSICRLAANLSASSGTRFIEVPKVVVVTTNFHSRLNSCYNRLCLGFRRGVDSDSRGRKIPKVVIVVVTTTNFYSRLNSCYTGLCLGFRRGVDSDIRSRKIPKVVIVVVTTTNFHSRLNSCYNGLCLGFRRGVDSDSRGRKIPKAAVVIVVVTTTIFDNQRLRGDHRHCHGTAVLLCRATNFRVRAIDVAKGGNLEERKGGRKDT
jgi:hypothetical protein